MADYKLRLDIDEKELAKKIEQALKGAKIDSSIFGGDGGEATKQMEKIKRISKEVNVNMKHVVDTKGKAKLIKLAEQEKRLTKEHMHDLNIILNQQNRLRQIEGKRMSYVNALARGGGAGGGAFTNMGKLVGGAPGGAMGAGLDLLLAKRNFYTGKSEDVSNFLGPGKAGGTSAANKEQPLGSDVKTSGPGKGFTPVKLMGMGAGLAGAAGLGKMILDSSPMLKAMLKLLNVGIMLILRPIGDFIGFMLRPLLIKFVQEIAIPMYRNGSKLAKEWGTKFGKALIILFTNPAEFFKKTLINPMLGTLEKWFAAIGRWFAIIGAYLNPKYILDPEGRDEEIARIEATKEGTEKLIDLKYPGLDLGQNTEIGKQLQSFTGSGGSTSSQDQLDTIATINKNIDDSIKKATVTFYEGNTKLGLIDKNLLKQWETLDGIGVFLKANFDTINEILRKDEVEGITPKQAQIEQETRMEEARLNEEYRQLQIKLDEIMNPKTGDGPYGNYANKYFECGGAGDPSKNVRYQTISDSALRILAKFNNYKIGAPGSGTTSQASCNYGNTGGKGFDITSGIDDRIEMQKKVLDQQLASGEITAEQFNTSWNIIQKKASSSEEYAKHMNNSFKIMCTNTKLSEMYTANMSEDNKKSAQIIRAAMEKIQQELSKLAQQRTDDGERYTRSAKTAQEIQKNLKTPKVIAEEHGWMVRYPSGNMVKIPSTNLSKEAIEHYKSLGASITPYANGGIINEPIFGIGASGRKYSFGEKGPETIIPGTGGSSRGGNSNIFNVTINASGLGSVSELKPLILKMLKESTSRVGMI